MIGIFLFLILPYLIQASSVVPVLSAPAEKSENVCSKAGHARALTKRAFKPRVVKGAVKLPGDSRREIDNPIGRYPQQWPNCGNYKLRVSTKCGASQNPRVEHGLIHSILSTLDKKDRSTAENVEFMKHQLKRIASSGNISRPLGKGDGVASTFEINLLYFLLHCFEDKFIHRWFQIYDSWSSLNTPFLIEARADHDPSFLYAAINSISPGLWKFCLPMKDEKFDIDLLISNPIARLSWFLDGLDPAEMIEYAQALEKPQSPTLQELMNRQLILEKEDKTEPSQKFAQASWFAQRMGWDHFQRIILDFEKFTPNTNSYKFKMSGFCQPGTGVLSTPKARKSMQELNKLLEKKGFLTVSSDENFSSNIMEWLSTFLTWLNDSKVQINRFSTWEMS
ncbi:uncharacterized protein PGTG_10759 [Puccinia graminis f. sp. tritici CRL 75-36-700-3]|uniref:Uncharacterized protein n=1 Tax=Puccinia graminis f. sp. tritici (strain CRL 75-36-700-3 / race SCCL) TaxID=418459 RepID=E3KJX5_PUCGT|nr:uncharacterized protein PGTG_10759 [Puccinia graminis f. sp. tritici CRL 75-36-700-3]EFP84600.2 hypothetical protein PGTG_10759 [Puccinia graminis f. sp. tritici CRL 75-36-700-3]